MWPSFFCSRILQHLNHDAIACRCREIVDEHALLTSTPAPGAPDLSLMLSASAKCSWWSSLLLRRYRHRVVSSAMRQRGRCSGCSCTRKAEKNPARMRIPFWLCNG
jgi:hypothetical protein